MVNFTAIQNLIVMTMNCIEGKINPRLKCCGYDFLYKESNICASESYGHIVFYIPKISDDYHMMDYYKVKSFILLIVAHELSHIEQNINYDRYEIDDEYRRWIENTNQNNAKRWIISNLSMIHQGIGDFSENVIYDAPNCPETGISGVFYIPLKDNDEMMNYIVSRLFLQNNVGRYNEFKNIFIEFICDGEYITMVDVKRNGVSQNPNNVLTLVYYVEKNYDHVTNKNIQFPSSDGNINNLRIIVEAHGENVKLRNVATRVDEKYMNR